MTNWIVLHWIGPWNELSQTLQCIQLITSHNLVGFPIFFQKTFSDWKCDRVQTQMRPRLKLIKLLGAYFIRLGPVSNALNNVMVWGRRLNILQNSQKYMDDPFTIKNGSIFLVWDENSAFRSCNFTMQWFRRGFEELYIWVPSVLIHSQEIFQFHFDDKSWLWIV